MAVSREPSRAGRGSLRNLIAAIATIVVADIGFGLTYPLLNVILGPAASTPRLSASTPPGPLGIILSGRSSRALPLGGNRMARRGSPSSWCCRAFRCSPHRDVVLTRFLFGVAGGTLYT